MAKGKRLSPIKINNQKSGHMGRGNFTPRAEDSINLYFNEINNKDCNPIHKDSEKKLFENMKNGCQKSRETLIKSNLRFVVSVAKHYLNQGLSFEDLVAEGNYGLMKALDKFNPDLGIKFFSYAVWWIRQSIIESLIVHGKIIKVPVTKVNTLKIINKRIAELEQKLERKPTVDELVELMNMDANSVNEIMMTQVTHVSLDAPMGGDSSDDMTLGDVIESDEINQVSMQENLGIQMTNLLQKLSPIEYTIVTMFYGIGYDEKFTLEQIATHMVEQNHKQVTRERIRQIKVKAIRKLRNTPNLKELLEYVVEKE